MWGINAWDIEVDEHTRQEQILVVPQLEPLDFASEPEFPREGIRVDDLQVSQFVTLLVENPRIGAVINAAAGKVVLLLGRFTGGGEEVLEALVEKLGDLGYVPVVFDFDEPEDRDTIETVAILAGLAKFVIADLTSPRSTPLEAHLVIPAIAVPFVPIVREPDRPFSMFTALQRKYPWVLPTVRYRSTKGLLGKLEKEVVRRAEREAARMRRAKHPAPPS